MKCHDVQLSEADMKERIRGAGLKLTDQRLAVLQVLAQAKQPLSAQTIVAKLNDKQSVDTVTVYRVLEQFANHQLVQVMNLHGQAKHYELNYGGHHHHIICEQCHTVAPLHNCGLEELSQKVLEQSKFARINGHHLSFSGQCQSCAKTGRKN